MRLFRPFFPAGWIYPEAIFRIKTAEKILYLTFDDGPDPSSTPKLLDILDRHKIKAMFFCNGGAASDHPHLMQEIRRRGHQVGNHGYGHLNGWLTSAGNYISDVSRAAPFTSDAFFRPPYGRLRIIQYIKLKRSYKIIFWDLMPYDFDNSFGVDNCLRILKDKIRPGSIIVLHDIPDSKLIVYLEEFILYAEKEGFRFDSF